MAGNKFTPDNKFLMGFQINQDMLPSVHTMNRSSLEIDMRTLTLLERKPTLNQRELALELGISLGKANYCLRALLAKGLLKAQNFKNSKNKLAYAYILTPEGITKRTELATQFLQIKIHEYEQLHNEIKMLQESEGIYLLSKNAALGSTVYGI